MANESVAMHTEPCLFAGLPVTPPRGRACGCAVAAMTVCPEPVDPDGERGDGQPTCGQELQATVKVYMAFRDGAWVVTDVNDEQVSLYCSEDHQLVEDGLGSEPDASVAHEAGRALAALLP
ncbi:MAG: hypothetical protein ACYCZN_01715 [Candidatus Dormibacteria bacterium]